MKAPLALLASATLLAGCQSVGELPTEQLGSANFTLSNGVPAGTARLLGSGDTVSLAIAVAGLTPGAHGFHLHTTGDCTRPEFTSAGGHLNPYGKGHGIMDSDGAHMGDLPNLTVSAQGTATATFDLRGNRAELLSALFDSDGTAIVIHADPDDGTSEPAGNAGKRVACAVLKQS
ncbi:superoxide dismutase family protein [Erythrobacter sp. SDW2]|uniref:superoxide dismutase family protein n=1 Tax=Erythrobacter sp. SDW2 TaxID=2907154 RepID=UPI001F2326BE|nr:superoxide dismutase family protein [Erythrobacter sp. SDW2]UIP07147.1 superoxide dismutase family protein [Erythrobacter sp. SDW2]